MADFLHCPNCHYPITQAQRDNPSLYDLDQIDSGTVHGRPDQLPPPTRFMDATLDRHGELNFGLDSHDQHNSSRSSRNKGKLLFSFALPKRLKRSLQQDSSSQPGRPTRPPPELCPPTILPQPGHQTWLKSSISAPFLSKEQQCSSSPGGSFSPRELNRRQARDISEGIPQGSHALDYTSAPFSKDGSAIDRIETSPRLPLLYSTPPTTASKLALKPSPLHYERYIPSSPPFGSRLKMPFSPETSENLPGRRAQKIDSRVSSLTNQSIYSEKTSAHTTASPDTPPTSPPPLPQRSTSRKTGVPMTAKHLAERMFDELDLISHVHKTISDANHKSKGDTTTTPEGVQTQNLEPKIGHNTQVHTAAKDVLENPLSPDNESAFIEAIEQVIRRSPELQQWLISRQAASHTSADKHPRESKDKRRSLTISAASASSELLPNSSRQRFTTTIPKMESTSELQVSKPTQPIFAENIQKESSDSPTSLLAMRQKLYEFPSDENIVEAKTHKIDNDPASTVDTQRSSVSSINLPLNCRRIEIEWRGKKVPILIHEDGKVFEGPCTDFECTQHASRAKAERS